MNNGWMLIDCGTYGLSGRGYKLGCTGLRPRLVSWRLPRQGHPRCGQGQARTSRLTMHIANNPGGGGCTLGCTSSASQWG